MHNRCDDKTKRAIMCFDEEASKWDCRAQIARCSVIASSTVRFGIAVNHLSMPTHFGFVIRCMMVQEMGRKTVPFGLFATK